MKSKVLNPDAASMGSIPMLRDSRLGEEIEEVVQRLVPSQRAIDGQL